jgi:tetratricopeptide (TPR) repeat protein
MIRRVAVLTAFAFFVLVLALALDASADEEIARQNYERAMKAYNLQEWKVALDFFRGAYLEKPDSAFLFNIAQCQRQLGEYEAAARSYRAFLNQAPTANRAAIEKLTAQMEEAARDKAARAAQPPTGVQPPAAAQSVASSTITPSQLVTAPIARRRPWYRNAAGMSLGVVGLAGAIVGAALLGQGAAFDGQARSAMTLPDQNRLHDSAGTFTTAGAITIGIGGGALIVGAVIMGVQR